MHETRDEREIRKKIKLNSNLPSNFKIARMEGKHTVSLPTTRPLIRFSHVTLIKTCDFTRPTREPPQDNCKIFHLQHGNLMYRTAVLLWLVLLFPVCLISIPSTALHSLPSHCLHSIHQQES